MTTSTVTSSTSTIHLTKRAQRLHLSHLSTTHHAPPLIRQRGASRQRATALTPMARYPLGVEPSPTQSQSHEARGPR